MPIPPVILEAVALLALWLWRLHYQQQVATRKCPICAAWLGAHVEATIGEEGSRASASNAAALPFDMDWTTMTEEHKRLKIKLLVI